MAEGDNNESTEPEPPLPPASLLVQQLLQVLRRQLSVCCQRTREALPEIRFVVVLRCINSMNTPNLNSFQLQRCAADNHEEVVADMGLIRAIIGCIFGAAAMAYFLCYHRFLYGFIMSATTLGDSLLLSGIPAVLLLLGLRQVRIHLQYVW